MLIEFDGIQHFEEGVGKKVGKYIFTMKDWKRLSERDDVKSQWCVEHDIKLLRIAYNQINQIDKILTKIFKED